MSQLRRLFSSFPAPGKDGSGGNSERPLWWLLAGCVVVPAAIFLIASAVSYGEYVQDGRERLERDLRTVYEHALKVFETFDLSARYVDEVIANASDAEIRANEGYYNTKLKALTDQLPQLADVWVIDASGVPLVSGTVYPMPRGLSLADRDYFKAHKNNPSLDHYVSDVVLARATNASGRPKFFAISRKRPSRDRRFNGVTTVSVAPDYFEQYYSKLPQPAIAALIREDGTVLARYPDRPTAMAKLPADGGFMSAIRTRPESGVLRSRTSFDGSPRLFAYRRLPRYGVYVTVGLDHDDVLRRWAFGMSRHLIFGVPATLAMFGLGLVALRRTRREAAAHARLRQETVRREATENTLRQSQRMDAVGRLTGGIAHDFNNLLTAILGNLDLALRRLSGENERVHRSLTSAREASQRAATLVQRLLSFSRQHPLEIRAVDINRLVSGMSELLRRTIGETIVVETVLAGGLWKAAIDPNQLENALLNLAVNARDAMPEGGRLTVETANCHLDDHYVALAGGDVAPGQYVMVAITDTGTGMEKAVIERAFEPFFTTKPTGVGTGLGLSMVYGFVKQSGGHVRIYSEVGEGTTIKLYVPRLQASAGVPEWPSAQPLEPPAPEDGARATILLVEDDPEVNRFATEALQDYGYRVITVGDGPTALQRLQEEPNVDLLFTDVVLPGGMNGRQLADEVLRLRPAIKVLFATGYTRNAIIHQGRLDPDVELLSKPFTSDLLARKIAELLRPPRSPA
jgi:two-component system NtrC family sensor kinase